MTLASQRPTVPHRVLDLVDGLRTGGAGRSGLSPIATGFEPLDSVLDGGFLPGDLVILGGQPGAGKTLCALQWARTMSGAGRPVAFACFEHDELALLHRLVVQELVRLPAEVDPTGRIAARAVVRDLLLGLIDLDAAVEACPLVGEALAALELVAPNLMLIRASSRTTASADLDMLAAEHLGPGGVLFVDYLQKLPSSTSTTMEERVHRSAEAVKELAMANEITVVAISAIAAGGLEAPRLRLGHLRGSDGLAHEADVAIMMSQKVTAVSERHLKYDLTQVDEARRRTVFSVDKNRRGEVDLHLEFVKDFANLRFDPAGAFVSETLADV